MESLWAFSPVFALFINVASQIIYYRFTDNKSLLKSVLIGFISGAAALLLMEYRSMVGHYSYPSYVIVSVSAYAALGYCYFHFINLGETARRIRLLMELYGYGEGLAEDELLRRYNAGNIIEKRIGRLVKSGQIVHKNGRYSIGNPVMLHISRIITFFKLLIMGKRSEFD